ncbi:diacylglycerol kinase family protein [Peribacillus deserti]|uniref:Diacylglycerol kinase n=1 Tax=Peribacillus deserti TaxID=673318 RepID=A0A2N5M9D7_9BACI|nr:diacylglycerol kinase family protein [Peribacillus deserti]PLT30969.1 diacylglycerol kinase [Peribacillus deserti]
MNTGLQGHKGRKNPFYKSVSFAANGIYMALKTERNVRIHAVISVLVLIAGWILNLTQIEWLFIFLSIGVTISLELVNSALERAVDLATEEYHLLAKQAKDMAAGAVLFFSFISIIIGLVIFVPRLMELIWT